MSNKPKPIKPPKDVDYTLPMTKEQMYTEIKLDLQVIQNKIASYAEKNRDYAIRLNVANSKIEQAKQVLL